MRILKIAVTCLLLALSCASAQEVRDPPVLPIHPPQVTDKKCDPLFSTYGQVYPGTLPRWVRTDKGHHVWWFCKASDGRAYTDGWSCAHGVCDMGLASNWLQSLQAAPDKKAYQEEGRAKYLSSCVDANNAFVNQVCEERWHITRADAAAQIPQPPAPPPAEIWRVARNASAADGSRPVYPVAGGTRSRNALPAVRAPADSACDPATKIIEGTSVYMSVLGDPARVALCTKR